MTTNLYIAGGVLTPSRNPTNYFEHKCTTVKGRSVFYSQSMLDYLVQDLGYTTYIVVAPYTKEELEPFVLPLNCDILEVTNQYVPEWLFQHLEETTPDAYAVVLPNISGPFPELLRKDKEKRFNLGISTYNTIDGHVGYTSSIVDEDLAALTAFANAARAQQIRNSTKSEEDRYYEYLSAGGYP